MSNFSSFDALDDDFEKTDLRPKHASEATEKLADGDHECEITLGEQKEINGGPVVVIKMTVISEGKFKGWAIEKPYFLTKNEEGGGRVKDEKRLQELKTDLSTMGFDVANWTPGNNRPFSAQLKIACAVMKGIHLKVRKKQNGEYANLYLNKRLLNDEGSAPKDGKPLTFGPVQMVAAPPSGASGFVGGSTGFDVPGTGNAVPTSPPPANAPTQANSVTPW